jgi:formylglycine-generating enzyme required for sulfatase activity
MAILPVYTLSFTSLRLDRAGAVITRVAGEAPAVAEELGGGLTLELVEVPGGRFTMGTALGPDADEQPAHRVSLPAFWLGRGPVTQAQWRAVMGKAPPCRFKGDALPVENVSWHDAVRFCQKLSARTSRAYGLPSEAQWEYACRAGSSGPFGCGETITADAANYNGEFTFAAEPKGLYRHTTTEAGAFAPNAFGLFDMHGNVWEWCADHWHADYQGAPGDGRAWLHGGDARQRVARGGCWHDTPQVCRSAARLPYLAGEGDEFVGFRVTLPIA